MYESTTPALLSQQQAGETVRDLARQLRLQADAVDAARQRLGAAQIHGWESPAGRNFRSYLAERTVLLAGSADLLREAALSMDSYATGLDAVDLRAGAQE